MIIVTTYRDYINQHYCKHKFPRHVVYWKFPDTKNSLAFFENPDTINRLFSAQEKNIDASIGNTKGYFLRSERAGINHIKENIVFISVVYV